MVSVAGIEPTLQRPKRRVIPFHHTEKNWSGWGELNPSLEVWKTAVQPQTLHPLNNFMYTHDTLTADGIQIHLGMSNGNTGYIIVNDIYDNCLRMFYFVDAESARRFIASL